LADILSEEQEQEEFTSKLSDEDESEAYFQQPEPEPEPVKLQKPIVVENIYYFDEITTFLNIENVVSMELMNFTLD
jgi:hypothetical protein